MRTLLAVMVVLLMGGAGPATAPAEDRAIVQRIAELGSETFATREAATEALLKAGKTALPKLREAAERSDDIEVRNRAAMIVAKLADGAAGGGGKLLRQAGPTLIAGERITQARVAEAGVNEISVTTRETAAVIRCDGKGIEVTVSAMVDERFESERYPAKDAAALAREHPEAFRLYDAIVTEMGGGKEEGKWFRAWFEKSSGPGKAK